MVATGRLIGNYMALPASCNFLIEICNVSEESLLWELHFAEEALELLSMSTKQKSSESETTQYQVQLCETFPSVPRSVWCPCLWGSPCRKHCQESPVVFTEKSLPLEVNLQYAVFIQMGGGSGRDVQNHIRDEARFPCDCQLALCWEMSLIPIIVCLFHGTLKWELSSGRPHKQLSHKHFSSASPKMA